MTAQEIIFITGVAPYGFSFETFLDATNDWEFSLIGKDAAIMVRANYIHCGALPSVRGKWITKRRLKQVLQPILDQYRVIRTQALTQLPDTHIFIKQLGFKVIKKMSDITEYELTGVPLCHL